MARVYSPAHDGKALQNKKKGGPKEVKGGNGKPATPPAEETGKVKTDEEGEGV